MNVRVLLSILQPSFVQSEHVKLHGYTHAEFVRISYKVLNVLQDLFCYGLS